MRIRIGRRDRCLNRLCEMADTQFGTGAQPDDINEHSVDLRSDTVTKPTAAMYERMRAAPLGDDALDGDPTARALEEAAAALLGKDASLFVPSCTMANLIATLAHAQRGEQIIVESESHMYRAERGAATLTGSFYVPVRGTDGEMNLEKLEEVLREGSSRIRTAMIALETSHNNAGGTVLSTSHMRAVRDLAASGGIAVHLDGARLFNAAIYLGAQPAELAEHCDTVSLCLSKGLSAPVGAILAGDKRLISRARALRRMLGGQQRQVGIVAAAGLEGIITMRSRLVEDHARAKRLSQFIQKAHPLLRATDPQTNIVQVDVSASTKTSVEWVRDLSTRAVLVRAWGKQRLRCVTHRHIDDQDVERAARAFGEVMTQSTMPGGAG